MRAKTTGKLRQKTENRAGLCFIAALLVLAYLPFLRWLFWQSRFPYEGWDVVIPFSCGIIAFFNYRKLRKDKIRISPDRRGLGVIILGLLLKTLTCFYPGYFVEMCSWVILLAGLLLYFYGWRTFTYFVFPLGFLLLKLPWDEYILRSISVPVFSGWLAKIAAALSALCGFPTRAEGTLLLGPAVRTNIVERCTGLYTLTAKMLFGILFIYYSNASLKIKLWKSLAVLPIIQIINILRIVSVHIALNVWLGVYTEKQIHHLDDNLHKIVLIAALYFWAFGLPRRKKN
ncbi:MAG: exosortase/archaeosortase family protein [Candidatus Margulisbacteria bacterium]|jgi:exosortase|nr:exosortase/archaeosortase family protein [Candidatus Margulisiibacteriota bacterium]